MMRKTNLLFILLFLLGFVVYAQTEKKKNKAATTADKKETDTVKVTKPVPVFLGRSSLRGGPIGKGMFDSLLKQGLTSHDSLGNSYHVAGFTFTYAERNLYEDSVGNLVWMTDFLSERCKGDTISGDISFGLRNRTKAGDTVYFENISLIKQGSATAPGKSMRFEITK